MNVKYSVKKFGRISVTGKFPKTKNAALKESIRKWKWLVGYLEKNPDSEIPNANGQSCALCHIFAKINDDCIGCPVYEYTGLHGCRNTPYIKYDDASYGNSVKRAIHHAQAEVEFLESLLPKKPKK